MRLTKFDLLKHKYMLQRPNLKQGLLGTPHTKYKWFLVSLIEEYIRICQKFHKINLKFLYHEK